MNEEEKKLEWAPSDFLTLYNAEAEFDALKTFWREVQRYSAGYNNWMATGVAELPVAEISQTLTTLRIFFTKMQRTYKLLPLAEVARQLQQVPFQPCLEQDFNLI